MESDRDRNFRVVVLNNSFMPIGKCSVEKSMCLLFLEKAISVTNSGKVLRTIKGTWQVPSVISLPDVSYMRRRTSPVATKQTVFIRDGHKCVYCGSTDRRELTLDHVIPRARFAKIQKQRNLEYGVGSWQNLVCACKKCNNFKADRLLEEIKWKLISPKAPLDDLDINWDEIFGMTEIASNLTETESEVKMQEQK